MRFWNFILEFIQRCHFNIHRLLKILAFSGCTFAHFYPHVQFR